MKNQMNSLNKRRFARISGTRFVKTVPAIASLLIWMTCKVDGQPGGIPEPDLIMYGRIWNTPAGYQPIIVGSLTWEFQPANGVGKPVTLTTTLTNINDQFSYMLRVRCETIPVGLSFTLSPNTLQLGGFYSRTQVHLNGTNLCRFAQPSQADLTLSSTDRGIIQRVDLLVALNFVDIDGDDLPDE